MRVSMIGLAFLAMVLAGCSGFFGSRQEKENSAAQHRFWKEKMAASDIRRIVRTVMDCGDGDLVTVDEAGKVFVAKGHEAFLARDMNSHIGVGRSVQFDMRKFRKRPSEDEVLAMFLTELDAADFRQDSPYVTRD